MTTARYIVGDVYAGLAMLEPGSVDLVLTSPPFLALRSYLPADHPDKGKEIGSEPTPGEFIDTLLDVVEACERVLAPHGSMVFELGDTYSGSGGAGGDYSDGGLRDGQPAFDGSARKGKLAAYTDARGNPDGMRDTTFSGANTRTGGGPGWPEAKSLCLIPELFRVALVYGFNPLTGRTTPRWRARNVIRWCRPNPPVGALGDKVRPATSDMVVVCKARDRYFDLDAVREPAQTGNRVMWQKANDGDRGALSEDRDDGEGGRFRVNNPAGAPPLDHWWHDEYDQDAWLISTASYHGSHYATWPPDLLVRPVKAMCPTRVCRVCGEPSRRIVEKSERYQRLRSAIGDFNQRDAGQGSSGSRSVASDAGGFDMTAAEYVTVGWTDCGHDAWRSGVTLDPFAGSGTTLQVATGHGRDAIGIDLDSRNADLAVERVGGLFLTVEHAAPAQEAV
jgi:hypothetical protein